MSTNNHEQLKDCIRKILYHDRWILSNMETLSREVLQKTSDEMQLMMHKLMEELQLPNCLKYQKLFLSTNCTLNTDILVENILKKLLKAAHKWNTREVNDVELLDAYLKNPNRDCFDTLPELGIKNSPFTDFLLDDILISGKATSMRVYQLLKIMEHKGLHYTLAGLYYHPQKQEQIKLLQSNGIEFLEEYLSSEQESIAYSKELNGRSFFCNADWESALQSFSKATKLSDKRKSICYPYMSICCILLGRNIASEDYLYKSAEYFNSEDDEYARLYAVALAGHGELEMAKHIFVKSLKGNQLIDDYCESYLQIPAILAIVNKLMKDDTPTLTYLPSSSTIFFEFEE